MNRADLFVSLRVSDGFRDPRDRLAQVPAGGASGTFSFQPLEVRMRENG